MFFNFFKRKPGYICWRWKTRDHPKTEKKTMSNGPAKWAKRSAVEILVDFHGRLTSWLHVAVKGAIMFFFLRCGSQWQPKGWIFGQPQILKLIKDMNRVEMSISIDGFCLESCFITHSLSGTWSNFTQQMLPNGFESTVNHKQLPLCGKHKPDDSIRDLLFPDRWRSHTFSEGSRFHSLELTFPKRSQVESPGKAWSSTTFFSLQLKFCPNNWP